MIVIFSRFVKEFLFLQWAKFRGYETLADNNTSLRRWAICKPCKFFDGAQCTKCQCLAEAKVILATSHCPLWKWPRVWVKRQKALVK